MTSDAKIGLLVAFVFIVIIAFLINGPLTLLKPSSDDETIKTSINVSAIDTIGIDDKADEVIKAIDLIDESSEEAVVATIIQEEEEKIRFKAKLPPMTMDFDEPIQLVRKESIPVVSRRSDQSVRVYVVQPGDNLAEIAKKLYGQEEGNRRVNIQKITETNGLQNPDQIRVGQELKIPPLSYAMEKTKAGNMMDKIKHYAQNKITTLKQTVNKPSFREYTVRQEDSLWRIAQHSLGDGSRYHEIVAANRDKIDDADDITVGMVLKIPHK